MPLDALFSLEWGVYLRPQLSFPMDDLPFIVPSPTPGYTLITWNLGTDILLVRRGRRA